MTNKEKRMMLKWIKCWREAAPELESMRSAKIRSADTTRSIINLDDAFRSAMLKHGSKSYSGLVEQQKLFMKLSQK